MILPVTEDGVRSAGSPNKCFYCGEPKGAPHAADCVIPQRTVVLAMTIEYVVSIPAYWDVSQVEFHRNDSSWCSANDLRLIADQADAAGENMCNTCSRTQFRFIREATETDMEEMGYNANERQARAKEAASGPSLREKEPEWKLLPDEQAWWWYWIGSDYTLPHVCFVMVSKTGAKDRYFVADGKLAPWCDTMEGFWLKVEYPNVPIREEQKQLKIRPPKTEASK